MAQMEHHLHLVKMVCHAGRLALAIFCVFSAGCALEWPNLPSTAYTGVVINTALNRPEPNIKILASRPSRWGLWPMVLPEELGQTTTDIHGRFHLRTTTGYATRFHAESIDGRFWGVGYPKRGQTELVLQIKTSTSITSRVADPESDVAKTGEAAVNSIISYILFHPQENLKSLGSYCQAGVIIPQQLETFTANSEMFFGAKPRFEYHWGQEKFIFHNATAPIELKHYEPFE